MDPGLLELEVTESMIMHNAERAVKVLTAIKAKWPKFTPTETHRIRQGKELLGVKDGDYLYDMRGTIAKGATRRIVPK